MQAKDCMSSETLMVDEAESVSSLIGRLAAKDEINACIMDGDKFLGILDHSAFLRSKINAKEAKAGRFVLKIPTIDVDSDLAKAAILMHDANTVILPVSEDGKIVGCLSIFDVLRNLDQFFDKKTKAVAFAEPVEPFSESDSLGKAIHFFHSGNSTELPIVGEDGKLSGTIKASGLLKKYYSHSQIRDYGHKPGLKTKGFNPEPVSITEMPLRNFLSDQTPQELGKTESLVAAAKKLADNRALSLFLEGKKVIRVLSAKRILWAVKEHDVPMSMNVQYAGLEELDEDARGKVQYMVPGLAEKLVHFFNNEYNVMVHFKKYKKLGVRSKYSVSIRLAFPGATIATKNAHDWNPVIAVRKGFDDIEAQLASKYKLR